jgi:hypothetical protein
MEILTGLMLGVIAIELGALLLLSRKSTAVLEEMAQALAKKYPDPETLHPGGFGLSNFCVWRYRQGQWQVIEDRCGPGFHPGDPPNRAGDYEGEIVRKPASWGILAGGAAPSMHFGNSLRTNYCVWRFRQGDWSVVEDHSEKGFIAGAKPRRTGDYEGEIIRKPAVAAGR